MMYLDRLARVVPPRANALNGAGSVRALACNVATTSVELDNDIFAQGTPATPGAYGRALVRFHSEGGDTYLNFDTVSTVVANSAATSGNTVCMRVPKDQERDFELDPQIDKWLSARTLNGGSVTSTLRYWIVSFPSQGSPASG